MKIFYSFLIVCFIVMMIPNLFAEKQVPKWVKNTAGWWSNDVISETEFVNAVEYLIKIGVIKIPNNNCENLLKTYFSDDLEEISRICNTYDTTKFSELLPYVDNVNLNSHGFRGDDFSNGKINDITCKTEWINLDWENSWRCE